jgi:tRNA(fMet)-specific endonuclease VapC
MYLLDTNVCIDFLEGRSPDLARRMEAKFGQLTVSTISVAQLFVGSRLSELPEEDRQKIDIFLTGVEIAPFDLTSARIYGDIICGIGVKRKSFDRLIGVQAVQLGLVLVTRNEKHFADVPGLKVENWTLG